MIDIHTHILPGLDDGAKTEEIALAILQEEISQGVSEIVFTPHYYGKRRSPEEFCEKCNAVLTDLKNNLPDGIQVRLGAEVHFTGLNMPAYDSLCKLAIEGTKYILLELPFMEAWSQSLLRGLEYFIEETGYTPIIAHVERYEEVLKKPMLASVLVDMGCLLQVNAQAFLERGEKKFAFALLKHGLVHCLGSDAHDLGGRSPKWIEAKHAVEKAGLGEAWQNCMDNTATVLADGVVERKYGKPIKKIFGIYL